MASAFCSQHLQVQFGVAAYDHRHPQPSAGGNVALCTNRSSLDLRSHHFRQKFPSLFSLSSTSFIAGNSPLRLPLTYRVTRRSQPSTVGVIKAAFLFEWIGSIIRFITKVPMKLFVQKLEADLDRAAKMVKTGASVVIEVAKEADEFAEDVEKVAERAEEIAEKVSKGTDTAEQRAEEILDVLDGDKKVVITSYKVVDNEGQVAATSTTVAHDGNASSVVEEETSIVNEKSS